MAVHIDAEILNERFAVRPRLYIVSPAPSIHPHHALMRRRRMLRRARRAGEVAAWTAGGLALASISLAGVAGLLH